MNSLIHALISLAGFVGIAWFFGPAAGFFAGFMPYWGREGVESQHASRLPKAETWWMPWAPWVWPREMQLNAAAPLLACAVAWAVWEYFW